MVTKRIAGSESNLNATFGQFCLIFAGCLTLPCPKHIACTIRAFWLPITVSTGRARIIASGERAFPPRTVRAEPAMHPPKAPPVCCVASSRALTRGGRGLGKPACFGVGGGQRAENGRFVAAGELQRPSASAMASVPLRTDALGLVASIQAVSLGRAASFGCKRIASRRLARVFKILSRS